MINVRVSLSVAFLLLAQLTAAQEAAPSGTPKTPRDLAMLRAYHDKTTWRAEGLSQNYEHTIVSLWDQLIEQDHAWPAFTAAPVGELLLNSTNQEQLLETGISAMEFAGPKKSLDRTAWLELIAELRASGFQVVDSEWRHVRFEPPSDGPANSTVSMVLHVEQNRERRFIVKGDLKITWSEKPDVDSKRFVADIVDATEIQIITKDEAPTFAEAMDIPFKTGGSGREHPITIQPIIVQDLNGDSLPEVILAGYNRVFWNGGNWRFANKKLCDFPNLLVNAAIVADFSGDGINDLLCGVRFGWPLLYQGTVDGRFPTQPTEIRSVGQKLPQPSAITVGDVDGDGDIDVLIAQTRGGHLTGGVPAPYFDANDSFPASLLQNDGTGEFRDVTKECGLADKRRRRIRAATLVDLDGDTDLDLLITSDFGGTDLFLNDGKGKFTDATESLKPRGYALGMAHALGDFNLDGRIDFMTVGTSSPATRRLDHLKLGRSDFPEHNRLRSQMSYGNRMFLQQKSGDATSFLQAESNDQWAQTGWPSSSTTLDFDRDGDTDIFLTNGHITGESTRDYGARHWCHDIYFKANDRPSRVIQNFALRMRQHVGKLFSWHGNEHNVLLTSLPNGNYVDIGFLEGCASVFDSRAVVSSDLDLDGRVDLIYEHKSPADASQSVLRFLRNRSTDQRHWIGVHLKSSLNCKSTYGAQVTVKLDVAADQPHTLVQQRFSGNSPGSQHGDSLHFGLGNADAVESIQVRWPNGLTTELRNPKVDTYHIASPQ